MKTLILASESPRRKQLLQEAGFSFDVVSVKVSEIPDKNLNATEQILDIARRKARAAFAHLKSSKLQEFTLISADTEVIHEGQLQGKPSDKDDAFKMLSRLSGKTHLVQTGVCVIDSASGNELSQIETTQVFFKALNDEEIWTYIESGEPMDKAGAYGIQGLGGKFVEKIEGPFDNVVGLPVQLVKEMLAKI
ncbi:Maf family protein [Bdellovibrio sp. SKB1291214]|uniref:Maf family protein n=1 Tax=Bdellovibrio sp. SKB1291214 TaxID=1732569 RepID=UPI000B51657A|nr:Maf family protein [Bdellovibrio sp. SKB1291214]UYL10164.1 Maf family protein [Bdellovibrio sp. SKB1291214]